jgi:hypothetical protein
LLAAGKKVLSWKLIPLKMKKDCKSMTKTRKGKQRKPKINRRKENTEIQQKLMKQ